MSFTPEQIASVCHEANRGLQRLLGEQVNFAWEATGPEFRASIISGVEKLIDGDVIAPGDSHEAWREYKAAQGWTHGPVKDFAKKEHPQLVPFEELPPEQRAKDEMFFAIVTTLAQV